MVAIPGCPCRCHEDDYQPWWPGPCAGCCEQCPECEAFGFFVSVADGWNCWRCGYVEYTPPPPPVSEWTIDHHGNWVKK